jgi:methionyl-tRNA formyltransferase
MSDKSIHRVLLFGDPDGLPSLLKGLPGGRVCSLVAAEIRPQQHPALRKLAAGTGLPLLIQPKASARNYQSFVEELRSLKPDLMLAHSCSMFLRPELLAIPSHGGVNIHGGLLPQYRGANPIRWALLNEETETGVTMHAMTAACDAQVSTLTYGLARGGRDA